MKISVITPTCERQRHLAALFGLLQNQSYTHWEWLIYDTSLHPSFFDDSRVHAHHDPHCVTIGEKRNRLIERASGELIVHFDDDDYYAPCYLENVVKQLEKNALFKRHAWFSYHVASSQFFYWDAQDCAHSHYCVSPLFGSHIKEIDCSFEKSVQLKSAAKKGFGFSCAYRREVFKKVRFADVDFAEDSRFFEEVEESGFTIHTEADRSAEVVHVIHDSNTSCEFPQYRIPHFLVDPLIPGFQAYLERVYNEN